MDSVTKDTFYHRFSLELLPQQMLIGLRVINCKVCCDDDVYRPVIGIELGFIFFKIAYTHMLWDN